MDDPEDHFEVMREYLRRTQTPLPTSCKIGACNDVTDQRLKKPYELRIFDYNVAISCLELLLKVDSTAQKKWGVRNGQKFRNGEQRKSTIFILFISIVVHRNATWLESWNREVSEP
jgi:hypothetical protein